METILIILVGVLACGLGLSVHRAVMLYRELTDARNHLKKHQNELDSASVKLLETRKADQSKGDTIESLKNENEELKKELAKRPLVNRKHYRLMTIGVKGTGKTSLTLKWANPLTDLGKIPGSKSERYERTVSQQHSGDTTTEHVFLIHDWGGEYIVDAEEELTHPDYNFNGILLVVDLCNPPPGNAPPEQQSPLEWRAEFSAERVDQQLKEFNPDVLKFFFGPKKVGHCKAFVLFINKSDVIAGTPTEIEARAREAYKPLIDQLSKYSTKVPIDIFIGSAGFGHGIHHLFAHFVGKILPRSAYDKQLYQRLTKEASGSDTSTS